jgi:hypothetical protein
MKRGERRKWKERKSVGRRKKERGMKEEGKDRRKRGKKRRGGRREILKLSRRERNFVIYELAQ